MDITNNTTISEEADLAKSNRRSAIQAGKTWITTAGLLRWAGLAAMAAGMLYLIVQLIHPLDELASVSTARWAFVHYLSMAMDLLALLGVTGLYARQAEKAGRLGLIGYLLFSLFWAISVAFHFTEAVIEPALVAVAPKFVAGAVAMVSGGPSEVSLGALPAIYNFVGLAGYLLGGLLFGIATLRAGVLPRWAGGLLAFGAVVTLASGLITHPLNRIMAAPVGIALAWLGYALWSERQAKPSDPINRG
ncbi:MAG: hypothetical protein P4L50_09915 [Anaerolineaceae bacterium]|nr:hypothetical protein [Anaerolineaceae bacterium]